MEDFQNRGFRVLKVWVHVCRAYIRKGVSQSMHSGLFVSGVITLRGFPGGFFMLEPKRLLTPSFRFGFWVLEAVCRCAPRVLRLGPRSEQCALPASAAFSVCPSPLAVSLCTL